MMACKHELPRGLGVHRAERLRKPSCGFRRIVYSQFRYSLCGDSQGEKRMGSFERADELCGTFYEQSRTSPLLHESRHLWYDGERHHGGCMRDKEGEHFLPVYLQALLKLSRLPDTKSRTKLIGKVSDNIGRRNPYLMQLFLPVIKFNLSHLPCPSSS